MTDLILRDFILARIAEDEAAAEDRSQSDWRGTARFNPLRILEECKHKRWVVESHGDVHVCEDGMVFEEGPAIWGEEMYHWPCDDLKSLGAIWSSHPDYRPEWALDYRLPD